MGEFPLIFKCILSENPEKQKPRKPLQWALRSHRASMPSVTSLSFKTSFTAKGMTLVIPPGCLKPTEGKTEKTNEDWGIAESRNYGMAESRKYGVTDLRNHGNKELRI